MYFILSKVLLFLLYPALWVFVLLVIALIIKNNKRKQRLLIVAAVLLYVFSVPLFLNLFGHAWSVKTCVLNKNQIYSCAIILGGFSSVDKYGNSFFNEASDRFIEAVKLYNTGIVKQVLVSGGNGSLIQGYFKEATWVKTQLLIFKLPDTSILIENQSRNTIENAVFSKLLLQKSGVKPPYLLVTSDFHMRRAQIIFEKKGIPVIPYPCDFKISQNHFTWSDLVPDGDALGNWNIYLKEIVGYVVDKWK
ncbi:YdcF family protein [Mucilaginibacter sp.]